MMKITTSVGVFGPFNNVTILSDRYDADGGHLPFSVIGQGDVAEWDGPLPIPPRWDNLVDGQDAQWSAIKSRRDSLEQAGFPYMGHPIDSDPVSVQRIAIAVQAAQAAAAAGQPFEIGWRCKDDHTLTLDVAGMMGMAVALATYANGLHLHARTLKDQVSAATTVDELAAIDIESGWPE